MNEFATESPKFPRYQDYVIKDGRLVGEFEQMYRDWDDPWHQSSLEEFASDRAFMLSLLQNLHQCFGRRRALEIGCGLGHFANRIFQSGNRDMFDSW